MAAAKEKALAEHIAAHPEDAGRTVKDFRWVVHEIVLEPQEPIDDELTAKEAEVEKIEDDTGRLTSGQGWPWIPTAPD